MFEITNYIYKFSDSKYMLTKEQAIALYAELKERRNNGEYIYYNDNDLRFLDGTAEVSLTHRERVLRPNNDDMTFEERNNNYIHRDMIEMMLKGAITPIMENGKPVAYKESYLDVSFSDYMYSAAYAPETYTKELWLKSQSGRAIEVDYTNHTSLGLPLNTCVMTTRIADVEISGAELMTYHNSLEDYWHTTLKTEVHRNHRYKICIETVVYTNPDGTPHVDEYNDNKKATKPKFWSVRIFDIDDEDDNSEYEKWAHQECIDKSEQLKYFNYVISWAESNVSEEDIEATAVAIGALEYDADLDEYIDDDDWKHTSYWIELFVEDVNEYGFKDGNSDERIFPLTFKEWMQHNEKTA